MHRLFVGLELPPLLRDVLLGTMGGVAGARWQTDEQLHLTVRFIGEVDRHRAQDIAAALGQVRALPFVLALGTPGVFETHSIVDTLWAGVKPHAAVKALAKRVDQALVQVGIAPETRAFLPHITLARLGRGAGPVDAALTRTLPAMTFMVDGFALFESTPGAGGPVYDIVARYRL